MTTYKRIKGNDIAGAGGGGGGTSDHASLSNLAFPVSKHTGFVGPVINVLTDYIPEEYWTDILTFNYSKSDTGVPSLEAYIQTAIDALPTDGGTLYFPPGQYFITEKTYANRRTWTLPDSVVSYVTHAMIFQGKSNIRVLGHGAHLIRHPSTPAQLWPHWNEYNHIKWGWLWHIDNAIAPVTIEGLTVDGNGSNMDEAALMNNAASAFQSSFTRYQDIKYIDGARGLSIGDDCNNSGMDNCSMKDHWAAIYNSHITRKDFNGTGNDDIAIKINTTSWNYTYPAGHRFLVEVMAGDTFKQVKFLEVFKDATDRINFFGYPQSVPDSAIGSYVFQKDTAAWYKITAIDRSFPTNWVNVSPSLPVEDVITYVLETPTFDDNSGSGYPISTSYTELDGSTRLFTGTDNMVSVKWDATGSHTTGDWWVWSWQETFWEPFAIGSAGFAESSSVEKGYQFNNYFTNNTFIETPEHLAVLNLAGPGQDWPLAGWLYASYQRNLTFENNNNCPFHGLYLKGLDLVDNTFDCAQAEMWIDIVQVDDMELAHNIFRGTGHATIGIASNAGDLGPTTDHATGKILGQSNNIHIHDNVMYDAYQHQEFYPINPPAPWLMGAIQYTGQYGIHELDIHDNTIIDTRTPSLTPYAVFSYDAVDTTGTGTLSDYSGTVAGAVLVNDTAHGLYTDNEVIMSDTDSFNATYSITIVDADNYYILDADYANAGTGNDAVGTWTRTNYYKNVRIHDNNINNMLTADYDPNLLDDINQEITRTDTPRFAGLTINAAPISTTDVHIVNNMTHTSGDKFAAVFASELNQTANGSGGAAGFSTVSTKKGAFNSSGTISGGLMQGVNEGAGNITGTLRGSTIVSTQNNVSSTVAKEIGLSVENYIVAGTTTRIDSISSFTQHTAGTNTALLDGFVSFGVISGGSTVDEYNHFHATDMFGSGVTDQVGLLIDALTAGSTNYAIKTLGATPSLFGGVVTATGGFVGSLNGLATDATDAVNSEKILTDQTGSGAFLNLAFLSGTTGNVEVYNNDNLGYQTTTGTLRAPNLTASTGATIGGNSYTSTLVAGKTITDLVTASSTLTSVRALVGDGSKGVVALADLKLEEAAGAVYISNNHASGLMQMFAAGNVVLNSNGNSFVLNTNGWAGINNATMGLYARTFAFTGFESPASGGTGTAGWMKVDTNYIYICTATDTWKRVALTGGY